MKLDNIKVTFPHLGSYFLPFQVLFTKGLDVEYITPPPITNKTLELGSKNSPDFVCSPFKFNLGNYIESIEAGANTLLQVGGACRLQYYGELHEQLLRDMGYDFQFINFAQYNLNKPQSLYAPFKMINPNLSVSRVVKVMSVVVKMAQFIDKMEDYIRKNIGFEVYPGSFNNMHRKMFSELKTVSTHKRLKEVCAKYEKMFKLIPVDKPKKPLQVGIIGEYYTIMEPFSNHFIEKELAKMGIVVDRWMNISNSFISNNNKEAIKHISNYAKYDMGATCMQTIDRALHWAKKKYDGIIHVKSFGCTPETDAIPVFQNISRDYKIPILYFSFDTQTSETGIRTRLEAFHDMILMRKDNK
jgi:predicted nucleotide-binding protein (sugar kinase/HSP70/actin superfamily)